jgi:nicotinate-nucleotide adenylyltransferase
MIALAIANNDKFYLDTRELLREQPSYALLTLKSLRKEYPQDDFFWILGEDAFADFHHWHQWQEIASLCHLLVVSRQHHTPIHSEVKAEIEFCFKAAGHEVLYLPMPLCPTASRTLRATPAQLQAEVPEAVWHFIAENEVYTHRSSNAG